MVKTEICYISKCAVLQEVRVAFHPQGYVQAEGKLCGQPSTGWDRGFPVCLPCSSFCLYLSSATETNLLGRVKKHRRGIRFVNNLNFKYTFLQQHQRKNET